MLVVMQSHATPGQIEEVVNTVREMGLTPHPLPGPTRTAIAITGNTGAVDQRRLEVLPGVFECIRVTKAYKLTGREMHPEDTRILIPLTPNPSPTRGEGRKDDIAAPPETAQLGSSPLSPRGREAGGEGVTIGPGTFTLIAGPCSVENEAMILKTAEHLVSRGIRLLRAGAFKPRTSPYSFQGLGLEGLEILRKARERTGIGIVTELMDTENADAVEEVADVIQIGTRNMQNYSLLRRVARATKPVLLKRGMAATLEEWLMAAEYVLSGGNFRVILCERGVRTFADHSRNTLDLSVIPPVKQLSHLPILVDPSHGTGKRDYVPPMALAALAAGADGLLLEVHPQPDKALSDGAQSLDFTAFDKLLESLKRLAEPLGRVIK
jgi:3-deoxy-7-phosphoheptulonate synthase